MARIGEPVGEPLYIEPVEWLPEAPAPTPVEAPERLEPVPA